ncbi:DUF1835 domain-containing protein [Solitalea koreensis]|uniref:DUF1835 domain-containing protein n=1 Tax=Solitalea koreensis TaxID=543615 RepID=A0A521AXS4_9SPHI|nr:DUF1835 domain-containing protein [Solitalea koreensis]SMO39638.1 hypothetical protein SAMN06265350_101503 [Solitalea koreensis]
MLHILNGDLLLKPFKHTHLPGEILIWRECMAEGPISTDDKQFWELRAKFISETYHSSPTEYSAKFLRQLHKLDHAKKYNEINLWFEFDLFCQVNMLCTLEVIKSKKTSAAIYWVTPVQSSADDYFTGYGSLNSADLLKLFQNRRKLSPKDLDFFSELWKAYQTEDIKKIKNLINSTDLPFVKEVFAAHLERLPQYGKPTRIEKKLQQIIDAGITNEMEICKRFWETESIYGYGDLQVIHALNQYLSTAS